MAGRPTDGTRVRQGRIDYRLQRRALLRELAGGVRDRGDVCDAHPDLVRAGRHLGRPVGDRCPVCDRPALRHVTYVFEGKGRRTTGGRAVDPESLARQVERYGDLTVYLVEVCTECHWHHLLESYRLLSEARAARTAPAPHRRG